MRNEKWEMKKEQRATGNAKAVGDFLDRDISIASPHSMVIVPLTRVG